MSNTLYDHSAVEEKWQAFWESQQLFQQSEHRGEPVKNPLYLLFAFAYPSGSGLHVGHVESKTALDIMARYYRMNGRDVFFPVGWDAFGLPAENYAVKTGIPPAKTTKDAITTFRRQIKRLGISYDWANELATNHPEYYRWTQWLFIQLYNKGLAYQGTGMVNWCPSCQTVLANEQVVEGACERCGAEVTQKNMRQWFFKITEYRDELISGLDEVDWPVATKQQQLNWIGKSEGAFVSFDLTTSSGKPSDSQIKCFTTRIDTIFGVTFVVISPEKFEAMGLAQQLSAEKRSEVDEYIQKAHKKTEEERKIGTKDKSGVATGLTVINPVNGKLVPLLVADYVLAGVGTGAVMGVPAHDERDFAFAVKHGLEVIPVIAPVGQPEVARAEACFSDYGELVNSSSYDGLTSQAAKTKIVQDYAEVMEETTIYKLRDWLISRQRYWGAPIPVIYDPAGTPHVVDDASLPWTLPTDVDFKPTGESPLVSSKEFQVRTEKYAATHFEDLIKKNGWDKAGAGWRPEYDTMDTFVDSSWYYLRYVDSRNSDQFASSEQLKKWLPVDFYMIGPEHIVLHLLYSRFFTKFLRDEGYFEFGEPFLKMRHQGMIMGPDGKKMSKSKGNVINPDEIIEKFGADTLRMYEMFMGPIEADKPWDVRAVIGTYKFLQRVHARVSTQLAVQVGAQEDQGAISSDKSVQRKLHQTICKLTEDIPNLKFNTAIAAMMEFMNVWEQSKAEVSLSREEILGFVTALAPLAPFLAEELWQQAHQTEQNQSIAVGKKSEVGDELSTQQPTVTQSVHLQAWPAWNPDLAREEMITLAVQVNGKLRAELGIPHEVVAEEESIVSQAKSLPAVQKFLEGKEFVKAIYVPGRIVSLVVR
jgi:leucyl-tRNA synthetase